MTTDPQSHRSADRPAHHPQSHGPGERETQLQVPQGTFSLRRHPVRAKERLRAWDAADDYVLHHLAGFDELNPGIALGGRRILVVNDSHGALAIPLAAMQPPDNPIYSWSDSLIAHRSMEANVAANSGEGAPVIPVPSTDVPPERMDVVLVKVPRANALLEDLLVRLRPALHADTVVIAAGMVKTIHSSTLKIFEDVLGPTRTSLARRKARLIFSTVDPDRDPGDSPWPVTWQVEGVPVVSDSGVFSAQKLDVGTRFFLDNLPDAETISGVTDAVDLGCGNGVLGTFIAREHPDAAVTFMDESYMAVSSAERTFRESFPLRAASFVNATDLSDVVEPDSVDLIVNNPPFHQDNALSDAVAWDMFTSAHRSLRPGGELWVVGNRHLKYHLKLHRIFGNGDTVAGNTKFVILRAVR